MIQLCVLITWYWISSPFRFLVATSTIYSLAFCILPNFRFVSMIGYLGPEDAVGNPERLSI